MNKEIFLSSFPHLHFKQDEILAPYTFMKVGGSAHLLVEIHSSFDLERLCVFCIENKQRFRILGGASNVVISDDGIEGLIILNKTKQIRFLDKKKDNATIEVESGVLTAELAHFCAKNQLEGIEYFVGVPGTVGGAVYNNSHYRPSILIGNYIKEVVFMNQDGKIVTKQRSDLQFKYDHSMFQEESSVILRVVFQLTHLATEKIQKTLLEVASYRAKTQPIGIPSSGCMYKNPFVSKSELEFIESIETDIPVQVIDDRVQIPAGFLIDKAGLKGREVGDAVVSQKHATYILNKGHATSKDIQSLCEIIEQVVFRKYSITLEREVFFIS